MKTIHMIGYEKISIGDFIDLLKEHNIKTIIDIRENPFSMRKDFIKKYLSEALTKNGINYIHIKQLGNPKSIREIYKEDKDTKTMLYRYLHYISSQDLSKLIPSLDNVCLMCYEANPFECHRIMIAFELFRRGLIDEIKDLRTGISRDEILLFCQNISNIESVIFRDYMHSWHYGTANREKRISSCIPSSV